jgi:hypothetical protein
MYQIDYPGKAISGSSCPICGRDDHHSHLAEEPLMTHYIRLRAEVERLKAEIERQHNDWENAASRMDAMTVDRNYWRSEALRYQSRGK